MAAQKKTGPDPLPAHPLVVGLTASTGMGADALSASDLAHSATDVAASITQAVAAAAQAAAAQAANAQPAPQQTPGHAQLKKFSVSSGRSPFTIVAGYLGGGVNGSPAGQVLFLDAQLSKWLLVQIKDISLFSRVRDDSAAFGLRDILWLKSDVRVVPGDASDSVEQSYLSGPFTRADQVPTTVTGGTFPLTGGLLMEAITPNCCGKTR
jgi:hypothetical protein